MRAALPCTLVFALAATLAADEPDPVRERLKLARRVFDSDLGKYRSAVEEYLAKREEEARNNANKKLVEQIGKEREAFKEWGDFPKALPIDVRRQGSDAQRFLERAYQDAVKEYVRAKKDREADEVERELSDILVASGRAAYLADRKPVSTRTVAKWAVEKRKLSVKDVEYSRAVIMHPDANTFSEGVYKLDRGYGPFRGGVAVGRPPGVMQKGPQTAPTFEILGNGKSLWKSKPVADYDEPQTFAVNLRDIDTLSLRVHCPGTHVHCWAYWLDPYLVR